MERTRSKTLKLFVVSDIGRRSLLLSSLCRARHREEHADSPIMPTLTRQLSSSSCLTLDFAMCHQFYSA